MEFCNFVTDDGGLRLCECVETEEAPLKTSVIGDEGKAYLVTRDELKPCIQGVNTFCGFI